MTKPVWPNGAECAVSLTFDDGLASQLEHAFPLLEKYGLKATFYLNTRDKVWKERLAPWRPVADAGHEIGNHTASHICSRQMSGKPKGPDNLEGQTLEGIERDILIAEERLNTVFGAKRRTFCYPCYQHHVGEGPTRQSYVPVVAKHFPAARGCGEFGLNHPYSCDLHYLWAWRCEGASEHQLIGYAESGASAGLWSILVFHGLDGSYLGVRTDCLERLLMHLSRHRDRIWTAPVIEVADYIAALRSSEERATGT